MASVCDVCGKGPGFGNNVSFSHIRTRRRFNPNIQTRRVVVSGTQVADVQRCCDVAVQIRILRAPYRHDRFDAAFEARVRRREERDV